MSLVTYLLLPDRWRIDLMRKPALRDAWLTALDAHPSIKLLDWASPRPIAGEVVIVAGLDLAAAELVLKLAPSVRVVAANVSWARFPFGARTKFLQRARRRMGRLLDVGTGDRQLPAKPESYLATLFAAAGVSA